MNTIGKKVAWVLVSGLAIHGALVACQSIAQSGDGGGDAKAAPNDCPQWEVASIDPTNGAITRQVTVPVGWEPVGSNALFTIRRCKP